MSARSQINADQGRLLKSNPGYVLRPDSAIAWDRACEKFGKKVLITGALRSLETQTRIFKERYKAGAYSPYGDYRRWNGVQYGRTNGAAAAVPGTSNHGSGDAVDVKTSRSPGDPSRDTAVVFTSWGDKDRTRFLEVAKEFGWDDDEGRRVGELWHLTYYPDRDKHRGSGATTGGSASSKKRKPHRIGTIKRRSTLLNGAWRVKLWQRFLIETGDLKGKADGKFGPSTESATKRYQKRAGLVADGVVGSKTWYRASWGTQRGLKGARAEIAQRVCGLIGKNVDGKFGPASEARAKEVQRWLGVSADGHWGPKTIDVLLRKG